VQRHSFLSCCLGSEDIEPLVYLSVSRLLGWTVVNLSLVGQNISYIGEDLFIIHLNVFKENEFEKVTKEFKSFLMTFPHSNAKCLFLTVVAVGVTVVPSPCTVQYSIDMSLTLPKLFVTVFRTEKLDWSSYGFVPVCCVLKSQF
jgi:hypothetical protein